MAWRGISGEAVQVGLTGVLVVTAAALLMIITLAYVVPTAQHYAIFSPVGMHPDTVLAPNSDRLQFLSTEDGERLAFLHIPAVAAGSAGARAPTAPPGTWSLYFHGRRGNVATSVAMAVRDAQHGMDVIVVDYRGYGASSGRASEAGLFLDGEAVVAHVERTHRVPRSRMVLHGFSMGCAVAVHLAARFDDFGAVVLEAPFATLTSATLHMYAAFRPLRMFMTSSFSNIRTISRVKSTPLLVVTARADECVAWQDGRGVFDACGSPHKRFEWSSRVSHIGPHLTPDSYAWVVQHLQAGASP